MIHRTAILNGYRLEFGVIGVIAFTMSGLDDGSANSVILNGRRECNDRYDEDSGTMKCHNVISLGQINRGIIECKMVDISYHKLARRDLLLSLGYECRCPDTCLFRPKGTAHNTLIALVAVSSDPMDVHSL